MSRKASVSLIVCALLSAPLFAQAPPAPEATIKRATSAIEIDGRLDEPAWATAAILELEWEWFPGDQIPPPVETECLLAFDDANLYVAFRAYDPEPDKIRAHLMDRDEIETFVQDDHVSLIFDTFNDQRRGFQFRVNPLGVQADAIFSEVDGIEDFSWDVIWDSAGKITDFGYVVELAIPFSQLRFPGGGEVQTWGVEAGRSYPRNVRHRMSANPRDRNNNCLLCQFNKVTGFEGLKPGLNLEIVPALTAERTDSNPTLPLGDLVSGDEDVDLGVTVSWGATPNTTFNAAINPDFSQVEADVAQLSINQRFALFFPERRPFFLEGVDFFSTRINAVFTRTVADPDWGAKMTSKTGKNLIGVFVAQDNAETLLIPSNQGSALADFEDEILSGVVRYRRDVGKSSTLGALYTGRDGTDYHNHVAGVDGRIRFNKKNDFVFQYLYSNTRYPDQIAMDFNQPTDSFGGGAMVLDWNRVTEKLVLSLEYEDRDENFRADSGFVSRVDSTRALGVVRRNFRGEPDDWYSNIQIGLFGSRTENQAGELSDSNVFYFASLEGPLQSFTQLAYEQAKIRFGGELFDNLVTGELFTQFQPTGKIRVEAFVLAGDSVDFANVQPADILLVQPALEFKIGRRFNAQLDHTFQQLDVAGGELFEANLTQTRFVFQFNVRTFVRAILQYEDIVRDPNLYTFAINAEDENLFSQLLFSYKINPKTVAFVGYSDVREGTDMYERTLAERTFFLKLSYAWVR